jgi:hypothetical protein
MLVVGVLLWPAHHVAAMPVVTNAVCVPMPCVLLQAPAML